MNENDRIVKEGTQYIGEDEEIVYGLTTTPWGSSPSSPAVVAYDITDGGKTNVSDTVLEGVVSASGDVITLPKIKSLTAGNQYRIEILFTSGSQKFEVIVPIEAQQ